MNSVPSNVLLCAQVWPLTTRVQDVLEGKNASASRVACVLHLMEKVCFARYYCFLTPTVCISNSCHIPCDHRQTHSGSEAGIHAAPVATVLPLTEASLNTEEPEIATEDKIAMIYHDLKRGHIYAQHKDRIPSANKASPACHDAA